MLDALQLLKADANPRITLVRTGGLGDTVLVLPALTWLREHLVHARLTLVGSHWTEALSPLISFPLEVVRFDSPTLMPMFACKPTAAPLGVFSDADALIIYTASPGADWVRNAGRACRGPVVIWPVTPTEKCHAAVHFVQALTSYPLELSDLPTPMLRAPKDARIWAGDWLQAGAGSRVGLTAIHPGSGGVRKCWPPECFAELAEKLHTSILLIEGPADAEACSRVRASMSSAVRVVEAKGLTLVETAALLEQCTLYVGNDSGLSHVAAALGIPTVAVFGPTDPSVWAPRGRGVEAVCARDGAAWPTLNAVLETAGRLRDT